MNVKNLEMYSNRFENISYQLVLALANKGCKRHSERHIYIHADREGKVTKKIMLEVFSEDNRGIV